MAGKPLVVAVVVLAVPARGNVGVDVRARSQELGRVRSSLILN
jgi:hypothetical protein